MGFDRWHDQRRADFAENISRHSIWIAPAVTNPGFATTWCCSAPALAIGLPLAVIAMRATGTLLFGLSPPALAGCWKPCSCSRRLAGWPPRSQPGAPRGSAWTRRSAASEEWFSLEINQGGPDTERTRPRANPRP